MYLASQRLTQNKGSVLLPKDASSAMPSLKHSDKTDPYHHDRQLLHVLQVYLGSFRSQEEAAMAHDFTCKT
jgi:hypothetical protein